MNRRMLSGVAQTLLVSALFVSVATGAFAVQPTQPVPFRVGVIENEQPGTNTVHLDPGTNVAHLIELLRQLGYPYDIVNGNQIPDFTQYTLIILYDSGLRQLTEKGQTAVAALTAYTGDIVYIGPDVDASDVVMGELFGVHFISEDSARNMGVSATTSSQLTTNTGVFQENVSHVQLAGATAEGYFLDNASRNLFPSQTYFQRGSGASSYFFAYDVSDWWKADPNLPWSRPAILVSTITNLLSKAPSVMLRPYPRNLDSVFIERIEDVDPLHTDYAWLARANSFLQEFGAANVPLAVALIPLYVNPPKHLEIPLNADSAAPLRDWLHAVIVGGGTIAEHGYTHQFGSAQTGVEKEFLVNGTWMSYSEQFQRISLGKNEIDSTLKTKLLTFEAPHYASDDDTLMAITGLGFKYLFADPNSPFFGVWYPDNSTQPSLVLIPETLSYIPLGVTMNYENWIKANVNQLLSINGILLQYDHLYDDTEFTIGSDTLHYILQHTHPWTATIDAIGRFELARATSYARYDVSIGSQITIDLGKFTENELTIRIGGESPISWVQVNGKQWPVFKGNYIVLPPLLQDVNTIVVGFGQSNVGQSSLIWGVSLTAIATCASFPFARKIFGEHK